MFSRLALPTVSLCIVAGRFQILAWERSNNEMKQVSGNTSRNGTAPHDKQIPAMQSVQTEHPPVGEYFPFAHDRQSSSLSPPSVGRCVPALQFTHVPAPVDPLTVEYLPVEHSPEQIDADVAPKAAENVPAAQSEHEDTANLPEKVPAGQAEHTDVPVLEVNLPAGQSRHVATDVAPVANEYLPTAQILEHVEAPVPSENLPASQLKQANSEVAPGLVEYFPIQHETQEPGVDAHLDPEYVPAVQLVHWEDPVASANVPASQGRQFESAVTPGVEE